MKIKQFNFSKHWKKDLFPHLNDVNVKRALIKGMVRYCYSANLRLTEDGFRPELWHGFGRCCNKQNEGRCETHGFSYVEGIPLFRYSRFCENERRKRKDPSNLSFYELWGSCHFISHFVLALAKVIYPGRKWKILTGEKHTVVIDEPLTTVMDFLNFKTISANASLEWVKTGIEPVSGE